MVRIDDTDAPGALEATQLVKAVLEPGFGRVGTITVAEWVIEEYELRPLPKILRGPV
jgi:hypothetical protein